MKLEAIERGVTLFSTPYCDITIYDDDKNIISFDVMESPETEPKVYIDNDCSQIVPVTFGEGKTLRIYTKDLKIKANYYIKPSVPLIYRDADERLFTVGVTGDSYTLSVSFPDPNEMVKCEPDYTEEDLVNYNIDIEEDCFVLRLYDREKEYIDIFAFWIWNIQHHMSDYESACDAATWWCP